MRNLMVYGKMSDMKTFAAMDVSKGSFPGNLLYASLIKEDKIEKVKCWARAVAAQESVVLQIRLAGTSTVLFSTAT